MLEGRSEEVIALSRKFFLKNENGAKEDSFSNWVAAEDLVIKETFRRLLSSSVDTITALTVRLRGRMYFQENAWCVDGV